MITDIMFFKMAVGVVWTQLLVQYFKACWSDWNTFTDLWKHSVMWRILTFIMMGLTVSYVYLVTNY